MVTPADIKIRFPEFVSIDDSRIQLFIDDAIVTVNAKCPNSDLMVAYLTAHLLTLGTQTEAGDTTPIQTIASESVGDVSRSFGGTASSSSNDNFYTGTAYGMRYLDLRKNCIGRPLIG